VWLHDHQIDSHPDRLTSSELLGAQRLFSCTPPADLPQGPLAALSGALQTLQWAAVVPAALGPLESPTSLNLTVGSPTMLAPFIRTRYEELRPDRIRFRMEARACPEDFECNHWPLLGWYLRSKKTPASSKASLLSALYGSFPTPLWLWAHGWKIDRECVHCGRILDLRHVINGCEEQGLFQKFLIALSPIPIPRPEPDPGIKCIVHGAPCSWETFALEPGRPVYTDGSAVNSQYSEIA
jgi:hypothetical protein